MCTPEPPGKVTSLKVTETSYTHLVLTWTKPEDKPGIQDEAKGYFVEIRQAECIEWSRCNTTPIITTSFSVKGLKSMDMYWVRVIATNDGGESAPEELANYVLAMPSPGMSTLFRNMRNNMLLLGCSYALTFCRKIKRQISKIHSVSLQSLYSAYYISFLSGDRFPYNAYLFI